MMAASIRTSVLEDRGTYSSKAKSRGNDWSCKSGVDEQRAHGGTLSPAGGDERTAYRRNGLNRSTRTNLDLGGRYSSVPSGLAREAGISSSAWTSDSLLPKVDAGGPFARWPYLERGRTPVFLRGKGSPLAARRRGYVCVPSGRPTMSGLGRCFTGLPDLGAGSDH